MELLQQYSFFGVQKDSFHFRIASLFILCTFYPETVCFHFDQFILTNIPWLQKIILKNIII